LPTHAHFRELCVLAGSGQLSAAEADELDGHLVACDECRSFLGDTERIGGVVIPQVLRAPRGRMQVPAGMRERFLARAASEGLTMQAESPIITADAADNGTASTPARSAARWRPSFSLPRPFQIRTNWVLAAAACLFCFALGAWLSASNSGAWRAPWTGTASPAAQNPPSTPARTATASTFDAEIDKIRALTAERDQLAQRIGDLAAQLKTIEQEKQDAETAWQKQLETAVSNAVRDHDALTQQSVALSARAADLQSQLDIVRQQQSLAEADLRETRAKTSEYAARLDLMQTQLRNQEAAATLNPSVPSPSEVSSLVAARNLHIIDVYDSNAKGERGRAFGRVFYVEGRSIVFYAYDLTAARNQKNITFHLWGEKAGSKETTLSLGVLHDDDPKERRWALTCNDTNVLAKINSVYVTAESPGKQNDAPRGPRVLYAYFGAPPNHP
jgi:hypothetical protein